MALSGYGGNVKIKNTDISEPVAEIGVWELEIEANIEETPKFNSEGWMHHAPGMKTWTGTFEGYWTSDDPQGQDALAQSLKAGALVVLELYTDETHKYSGEAYIEVLSVEAEAEGTVAITFDFIGNGPLSMPGDLLA